MEYTECADLVKLAVLTANIKAKDGLKCQLRDHLIFV